MKWRMLLLVGGGVFLSTMDSSMINVALPSIMRTFSAPLVAVQWVVLIYLLTITVTLLFWGMASDRLGKDTVYLIGIGVFTVASICCSLAPHLWVLVSVRFFQGLGAAMMMASGPGIIRDAFPRRELGRGLGLVGIATSAGLMTGPVVSGMLITAYSWRMIFLVTVPISMAILVFGYRLIKGVDLSKGAAASPRFDFTGAVLWVVLVVSLILYAHFLPECNWRFGLGGALWLLVVAALFVWSERVRTPALLPLHLFAKSYYHIGLFTAAVSFGSLFVVLVLLPFYLDYVRGLSADLIGLVMMAVPLSLFVVSPASGALYDRFGGRHLTTGGLLVCFVSLLLLAMTKADTPLVVMCGKLALLGMGQSMFLAPNTASLLARIKDDDAGVTAGLLATSRNLGMLCGAAFAGIVFAAWFGWFSGGGELYDYRPEQSPVFMDSFQATLLCAATVSLSAVLASWQRDG